MSIDDEPDDWSDRLGLRSRTRRGSARGDRAGALRRIGFGLSDPPDDKPHPFAKAGPKLKELREKSGWTVSEIADRTGVPLKILTAFEEGDSAAARELGLPDLEHLASACCGSLTDLLGPDH